MSTTRRTRNRSRDYTQWRVLSGGVGVFVLLSLAVLVVQSKRPVPIENSAIDTLTERLGYMTFDDERARLLQQMDRAHQSRINASPFSALRHVDYLNHLLTHDRPSQSTVDFLLRPSYRLLSTSPRMRYFIAHHCIKQTPQFLGSELELCNSLEHLLPQGFNEAATAHMLNVELSDYQVAMRKWKVQ